MKEVESPELFDSTPYIQETNTTEQVAGRKSQVASKEIILTCDLRPATCDLPIMSTRISAIELSDKMLARKELLGDIICYRRRMLGFTQGALARKINCSTSTICYIETGKCKDYRLCFMETLAEILQVDVFIFLCLILNSLDEDRIEQIYKILDRDRLIEPHTT